jgi:phenylalanyl-tRNA synthetase beta chain
VKEEIDLIEEVARVHGYDAIETRTATVVNFGTEPPPPDLAQSLRQYLQGAGFNEVIASSLQRSWVAELSGRQTVQVLNPVSLDMATLRTSLIPGALEVIRHNMNVNRRDFRFFEIGKTYERTGADPADLSSYREEEWLLLVLSGMKDPARHGGTNRPVDFFDLRGEVEALLAKFSLDKVRFVCYDSERPLSAENLGIEIHGTYAGLLGKVSKKISDRFDIGQEVYFCELKLGALAAGWPGERRFRALPRFPAVVRDLAFTVDVGLPYARLEEEIRRAGGDLLAGLELFDVFSGQQLGEGRKSLALTLTFQPLDHTLTDEEASDVVARIVESVRQSCGAELRASPGSRNG